MAKGKKEKNEKPAAGVESEEPKEGTTEGDAAGESKPKKGGGKKAKKGGKKSAKAKREEYERIRAEEARQEELKKQAKAEAKRLAKLKKEQAIREAQENEIRNDIMAKSCQMLNNMYLSKCKRETAAREQEEWERYLRCDGTPNPSNVWEINFYLYAWQNEPDPVSLDSALPKIEHVLDSINRINDYVLHPITASKFTIDLWKFMRIRMYEELFNKLNKLTFSMMLNVRQTLEPMNLLSGRTEKHTKSFAMGLFSKYYDIKPCIGETDDNVVLPVIIEFPGLGLSVHVPYQIIYVKYVLRVIWSKFDDFSILTRTYEPLPMPSMFEIDLFQYNQNEYNEKQRLTLEYKEQMAQRAKRKKKNYETQATSSKQGAELLGDSESQDTELDESDWDDNVSAKENRPSHSSAQSFSQMVDTPQTDPNAELRTPSVIMESTQDELRKKLANYFKKHVKGSKILNLRNYSVLGGIFHVDFLEALPQPVVLANGTHIQIKIGDHKLKPVPINMYTSHIVKQVYNKYRNRYGYVQPKEEVKKGKKNEDKKIAPPIGRLSVGIDTSPTDEEDEEITKDQKESKEQDQQLSTATSVTDSEERRQSGSSRMSTTSSKLSEKSFSTYPEEEGEEDGEEEDGKAELSSEESEDSYKSHDSAFEEFQFDRHEPFNFKPKITLNLPKHVLWFDTPFPVIWNEKNHAWHYNDNHLLFDIAYEEDPKDVIKSISFRYTRMGVPLALAVPRYKPLPFTNWELHPDLSKTPVENVLLYLDSELISLTFRVGKNELCMESIEIKLPNQDVHILDSLIGEYHTPARLIRKMRRVGIDIFPEQDSYLYIKDTTAKHYICEKHTYKCIALACTVYKFRWSKWNRLAGSKNMVINLLECIGCNLKLDYQLCFINPQRAHLLTCTEDAEEFTENTESKKFHPDLYWLLQGISCTVSKSKIKSIDPMLADTVYTLLNSTKILSYS